MYRIGDQLIILYKNGATKIGTITKIKEHGYVLDNGNTYGLDKSPNQAQYLSIKILNELKPKKVTLGELV